MPRRTASTPPAARPACRRRARDWARARTRDLPAGSVPRRYHLPAASTCLPDLEPREFAHAGSALGQQLLDRLLRIAHRRLFDEHDVLEERIEAALHDLRYGLLRLALLPRDLLGDPPLVGPQTVAPPVPPHLLP